VIDCLAVWHEMVRSRDVAQLDALLADEVVFHSPVVHTPQRGKALTTKYLTAALHVLNSEHFRYEREVVGKRDAVLEFVTELDGIHVNGVDLIRWDDNGQIVDFKVMLRPLKALHVVMQKMGEMLQRTA
jgi:SnoaL-like domain